jgi:acetyl esterase/lipase
MPGLAATLIRPLLFAQRRFQKNATIEGVRKRSAPSETWVNYLPHGVRRETFTAEGLEYELLIPDGAKDRGVILYMHGGGFVFPLYHILRFTAGYLSKLTRMRTLAVHYRLAPEHPFPAALEDCLTAYRWLLREGGTSPDEVVFFGESSGGNLVLTSALALRDAGDPLPAGIASISPAYDLAGGDTFWTANDPMFDPRFVVKQFDAYCGDQDRTNPLISPIHADLKGLPPLLIQVGGEEGFRGEAERLAGRGTLAGVTVDLDVYPRMWHYWHMMVPFMPEAREAMGKIGAFVTRRVEQPLL